MFSISSFYLLLLLTLAGKMSPLIADITTEQPPIVTLRGGHNQTEARYVRSTWELTDSFGFLPMPIPASDVKPIRLMVDVGLEIGSGILCLLRSNPNLGFVLGMEAHPINFGISYVNALNMMKYSGIVGNLPDKYSMVVPLGASNVNGMVEFYDSHTPACGSLLKSKAGAWFCAKTTAVRIIPVVRLDTILSKVPPNYHFYYLKTDTEGADHLVLQGAGDYISKFEMVSIECRPSNDSHGDGSREGVCNRINTIEYMKQHGFNHSSCDQFDCHFARLSEKQLQVAKSLHSIAGLSGHPPTNCSKYHKAQWNPEWDEMTVLGINNMSQTIKQQRRQLLSGDTKEDSYDLPLRRRSLINSAKAYADSLIAYAMRITTKPHQHRRSFLSIDEIGNNTAATESAGFPLVADIPPISLYMNSNATHMTGNISPNTLSGTGGININFLWKISGHVLPLKTPNDRTNRLNHSLIVSIGSKLGSGLVCMLAENKHLVFLGLEPHPIRFALSHQNIFRYFSYPYRATLLPLGAGNRSGMSMIKQSWTVGCEDSVSAHWRLNASLEQPQDCFTMPPVRLMLPIVRLDTLLTEKALFFSALHYLVITVDSGVDSTSALPKPLEILHGAGKLLSSFEMISVDCPLLPTSIDKDYTQFVSDCGMNKYFTTRLRDRRFLDQQPFYSQLFRIINYITDQGFSQWRCHNNACHFAKESSDMALAIYYHRIKSLHINKPIQMWPNRWAQERRGKCLDEIYHEEIKMDLRPELHKRTFRATSAAAFSRI